MCLFCLSSVYVSIYVLLIVIIIIIGGAGLYFIVLFVYCILLFLLLHIAAVGLLLECPEGELKCHNPPREGNPWVSPKTVPVCELF